MKKAVQILTAVVLSTLGMPRAQAGGFLSGNQLLESCTQTPLNGANIDCLGYTTAIADVMAGNNSVSGWTACFPEGVARQQIVDVTVRFLQQRPEVRHYTASSLVAEALEKAFPCK